MHSHYQNVCEPGKKKLEEVQRNFDSSEFGKIEGWIRYFFKENPDNLNEDEFLKRWVQLQYCLNKTGQLSDN